MIVVFLVLAIYYYSNVQVKLVESSRATCLPTAAPGRLYLTERDGEALSPLNRDNQKVYE